MRITAETEMFLGIEEEPSGPGGLEQAVMINDVNTTGVLLNESPSKKEQKHPTPASILSPSATSLWTSTRADRTVLCYNLSSPLPSQFLRHLPGNRVVGSLLRVLLNLDILDNIIRACIEEKS
jgi:hypothetical protein